MECLHIDDTVQTVGRRRTLVPAYQIEWDLLVKDQCHLGGNQIGSNSGDVGLCSLPSIEQMMECLFNYVTGRGKQRQTTDIKCFRLMFMFI